MSSYKNAKAKSNENSILKFKHKGCSEFNAENVDTDPKNNCD